MAETEYLKLGVDIETRTTGADETIKKMDTINDRLRALNRTASEAKGYNAGLMGKDALPLMDRTLGLADNISDALSSSRSYMSEMASFGSKLGSELSSVSSMVSGSAMYDFSNKSYGELSKLYTKFEAEVNKYKEAVNVNIASHQFYTTQQLKELDKEEDVVREKMELIKQAMQDVDAEAAKNGGMSRSEFSALNQDLAETSDKLRQLYAERQKLEERLATSSQEIVGFSAMQAMEINMRQINRDIVELENHSSVLNDRIEAYGGYWTDSDMLKSVEQMNASMAEQEKALSRIQTARNRILNASPADTQRSFARNLTQYENARIKLEQVKGAMDGLGNAGEDAGKKTTNAFKDVKKAIEKAVSSGFKSFLSISKKELSGISKIASNLKKAFGNWHKDQKSLADQAKTLYNTFYSLWRMFKTRLKRRLVGVAFEDFTTYLGTIAKISPRFNSAVSGFVVSLKTLGAQITAFLEPLAARLLPYFTQFVDMLTVAASNVAQFISQLTGYDTFVKATKGQYDFATAMDKTSQSTNKATKSAKEYKNTVLSFDELHKMNGDDDSVLDELGTDAVDLQMAEMASNKLMEIAKRIWDALNVGDFKGAGHAVGEAINEAFSWVRSIAGWEENSERFTKILRNAIDFVNGVVDGFDPKIVGEAIGDVLNTFIESLKILTDPKDGIDFYAMGQKLGQMLIYMFTTINWEDLGIAIVQGIQSALRFFNGILQSEVINEETGEVQTIFGTFGKSLANMFGGAIAAINPDDWAEFASGLFNGFFEFLENLFGDEAKWSELGEKLADVINKTFKKINTGKVTGGINALTRAFTSLIENAWNNLDKDAILSKLAEILSGLDVGPLLETIAIVLAPAMIGGLVSFGGSLLGSIGGGILGTIASGLASLIVFMGPAGWLAAAVAGIAGWLIGSNLDSVIGTVDELVSGIKWFLFGTEEEEQQPASTPRDDAEFVERQNILDSTHLPEGEKPDWMDARDSLTQFGQSLDDATQDAEAMHQKYTELINSTLPQINKPEWSDFTLPSNFGSEVESAIDRSKVATASDTTSDEEPKWKGLVWFTDLLDRTLFGDEGSHGLVNKWAGTNETWWGEDLFNKLLGRETEEEKDPSLLSNQDGTMFTDNFTTQLAEKTKLPEGSVGTMAFIDFKEGLMADLYTSFFNALNDTKDDSDNGDVIINIDGNEVARAVNKANSGLNKRTNPVFAF